MNFLIKKQTVTYLVNLVKETYQINVCLVVTIRFSFLMNANVEYKKL